MSVMFGARQPLVNVLLAEQRLKLCVATHKVPVFHKLIGVVLAARHSPCMPCVVHYSYNRRYGYGHDEKKGYGSKDYGYGKDGYQVSKGKKDSYYYDPPKIYRGGKYGMGHFGDDHHSHHDNHKDSHKGYAHSEEPQVARVSAACRPCGVALRGTLLVDA